MLFHFLLRGFDEQTQFQHNTMSPSALRSWHLFDMFHYCKQLILLSGICSMHKKHRYSLTIQMPRILTTDFFKNHFTFVKKQTKKISSLREFLPGHITCLIMLSNTAGLKKTPQTMKFCPKISFKKIKFQPILWCTHGSSWKIRVLESKLLETRTVSLFVFLYNTEVNKY